MVHFWALILNPFNIHGQIREGSVEMTLRTGVLLDEVADAFGKPKKATLVSKCKHLDNR